MNIKKTTLQKSKYYNKLIILIVYFILFLLPCRFSGNEIENNYPCFAGSVYEGKIKKFHKNQWKVLPIRSEKEYKKGMTGGEAEQHLHGIARCLSKPDYIYLSHDVSGAWRSTNAGKTWHKTLDKGLYANKCQSIEVDPANPDIVFLIADNAWNRLAKDYKGLYRSINGGEDWELVLQTETNYDPKIHRIFRHNIAYDPTSAIGNKVQRWYAAFAGNGIFRSDDGGKSWPRKRLSSLRGHSIVYAITPHPKDGKTLYVATNKGFYISYSRGKNLKPTGNLPTGHISSIAVNIKNPHIVYIALKGKGLYRSTDNGKSFSMIKKFDTARVFINPGYPEIIYLTGLKSNTIISHDNGKTWYDDMETIPAPGLGRDGNLKSQLIKKLGKIIPPLRKRTKGSWKSRIAGELSGIVPNPENPDEAVAYSRATIWKTTDGGKTFKDSSTLFTGFAWGWSNSGAAFDLFDKNRFAFFNFDVGMTITNNGGKYFELRNKNISDWFRKGIISWIGTYSGAFQPVKGSKIIVASVGDYWRTQLMRSEDEGKTWNLIENLEENNNFFISFNYEKPNIVYAGNKISHDAGKTFTNINFGEYSERKPQVIGMCHSYPDTIYAIDKSRKIILKSDNTGKTWQKYANPGWKFSRMDSRPTFTVAPNNPDIIYTLDKTGDLATFNGRSWKSLNALKSAFGENPAHFARGNFIRAVTLDPGNPDIIYAGMAASGISHIWRSKDSGKTWQNITCNLARTGIGAISVNPHTGDIFTGSSKGTWILQDLK
ncbi:MAG: hypothetical protein JW864_10185 [Spirochaetes bacterium]|nr:hypothetical protein [Spirochaetota bacterium]